MSLGDRSAVVRAANIRWNLFWRGLPWWKLMWFARPHFAEKDNHREVVELAALRASVVSEVVSTMVRDTRSGQ